jgi:thiol-disulfide isomerase/thioredoxin
MATQQNFPLHTQAAPGRAQAPFLLMASGLVLIITAIVLVITLPGSPGGIAPAQMGRPLTNFSLVDLHGSRVNLSDYQGQVVLVNVWATWCPPCRAEMPALQAYYNANRHKGFVVLAIDAGDERSEVVSFANELGLNFPILLDPQSELVRRMNIYDYPTSLILDRSGVVRNIHIGLYKPDALAADLAPLLNNR